MLRIRSTELRGIISPRPAAISYLPACRRLLPVRTHVDPSGAGATALAAFNLGLEPRHQRVAGVARHIDQSLVSERIAVAERNQVMDALFVHVAERRRRVGWVVGAVTRSLRQRELTAQVAR